MLGVQVNERQDVGTPVSDEKLVPTKDAVATDTLNENVSTPVLVQKTSNATPPTHGTTLETPAGSTPETLNVYRLPDSPDEPDCLSREKSVNVEKEEVIDTSKSFSSEPSATTPRKMLLSQMHNSIPSPESIATKPEANMYQDESILYTPCSKTGTFSSPEITEAPMDTIVPPPTPSDQSLKPNKLQFHTSHASLTEESYELETPQKESLLKSSPSPVQKTSAPKVPYDLETTQKETVPKPGPSPVKEHLRPYPLAPVQSWASVPFDCVGEKSHAVSHLMAHNGDFPDDEEPLVPQERQKSVVRTLFGWIETQNVASMMKARVIDKDDVEFEEENFIMQPRTTYPEAIPGVTKGYTDDATQEDRQTRASSSEDSEDFDSEDEENPPRIPYTQACISAALQRKRNQSSSRSQLCKLSLQSISIICTIAIIGVIVFLMMSRDGNSNVYAENAVTDASVAPTEGISGTLAPQETEQVEEEKFPDGFYTTRNEYCTSAHHIYDSDVVTGSTVGHIFDETVDSCGDSMSIGRAAWYLFVPEETKLMEISTCDGTSFDTQISIATGLHCDNLSCVTFDDQGCGDQSRALFYAVAGEKYYISVHGYRDSKGDFELSIREAVSNDSCSKASVPLSVGTTTSGTTAGALTTDLVGQCGDVTVTNQTGVWYRIEEAEGWLRAQAVARGLGFVAQISIYRGVDCESLICEGGSSSGSMAWRAEMGETYFIFVTGPNMDKNDFDLSLSWDWQDTCDYAIPVVPGGLPLSATTEQARLHNTPACGEVGFHSAPGMWFSVVGNGNLLAATTCGAASPLDSHISVYRNGCNALQCVGATGVDMPCGATGAISWISEVGVEYMLYVSGRGSRVGDFSLRIIDAVSDVGQQCESAITASVAQKSLFGSNIEAEETIVQCGDSFATKGRWYVFDGTGSNMTFSTCNSASDFDARVSLFAGSCGSLECMGSTRTSCEDPFAPPLEVETIAGTQYYLLVHGSTIDEVGTFELTLQESSTNDSCGTSSSIEAVTNTYFGSTTLSTTNPEDDCGANVLGSYSSWYSVVGNGDKLFFNTCSENTEFVATITVYQGDCASLSCVTVSKEKCGSQELVSFESVRDVVYSIRVSSLSDDQFGNFVLQTSVKDSFFGW